MSQAVKPIPEGHHTVTPYIVVSEGAKAIEFYQKAFGAKLLSRNDSPDGKVMHAKLQIGDSIIMLSDEFPSSGCGMKSPVNAKAITASMHLYVNDADQTFEQAVKAGATVQMPLDNVFWGDRYGQVMDPFGHLWSIATQKEVLTDAQIEERAIQFFSSQDKH